MYRFLFALATVTGVGLACLGTKVEASPRGPVVIQRTNIARVGLARAACNDPLQRGFQGVCYLPQHRCYAFLDPLTRNWVYWYQPLGRYLPVAYLTMYPPTPGLPGMGTVPPGIPPVSPLPPGGTPTPAPEPEPPPTDPVPE